MHQVTTSQPAKDATSEAPVFGSLLCGIDGSRASLVAAQQAGALAQCAPLRLLAITWEQGVGATAIAVLSRWRAERCLDRATQELHTLGIKPRVDIVDDAHATERLLREAREHDLLVVGMHARSRRGGIVVGSTASTALHRATVPVLIARQLPAGTALPDRILLAHDGTDASRSAAHIAARLAALHGSDVTLVASADHEPARRHALAEDAAAILRATGVEPVVLDEHCSGHEAIAAAADELGTTLLIVGSRGLTGATALHSTSERVAHEARCPVLVARPRG